MSDELKSAWEIALEKLEAGDQEPVARLTPEQKEEVAEVRRVYKARIAEREIAIQSEIRKAARKGEFERIDGLRGQLAEEKQTLEAECEEKVAKIREA